MSGTRAQVRAVMPRALITVALSVHAYALYLKGFGWRLPGPFGLCVHTGSHLTGSLSVAGDLLLLFSASFVFA